MKIKIKKSILKESIKEILKEIGETPNQFGDLYLTCGIPGSGKTTKALQLAEEKNLMVLSSDDIREKLYGDARVQGDPKEVFAALDKEVEKNLRRGQSVVYDATNLTRRLRQNIMQKFSGCVKDVYCILLCTNKEECLRRNASRDRQVPVDVINRMYERFEVPRQEEGFKQIIYIR